MRARMILLVVVILAVAGFAALNWAQFMTATPLNFGLFRMDAPLGALLLGLLVLGLVLYLLSSTVMRSRMRTTENRYTRDLQAQRDLADKAEASRFTELRQYLDSHFREDRQRGSINSSEFERSVIQGQRELRAQLDQITRALESRLSHLESRTEPRVERVERVEPGMDMRSRPVDPSSKDRVKL